MPDSDYLNLDARLGLALLEDLGVAAREDVTSRALVPADRIAKGVFLAKGNGVVSGVSLLPFVFKRASNFCPQPNAIDINAGKFLKKDGDTVKHGDVIYEITGPAQVLLLGERTSLNLLCHLSGVATQTARYVEAVKGTKTAIVDTRKTTPLWRDLEKAAVKHGGGKNHRFGLHDMVLIKDNHLALWGVQNPAAAVNKAKELYPRLPIQVEVTSLEGLQDVCKSSAPEFILLDNFSPEKTREAVKWVDAYFIGEKSKKRPELESSGGITLDNIRAYAEAGVDRISIGALTHSVKALDISLEIEKL